MLKKKMIFIYKILYFKIMMSASLRSAKRFISTQTGPKISHQKLINNFFLKNPNILKLKPFIPTKYLAVTRRLPTENLYLICPDTAKKIAAIIMPYLNQTWKQLVAETNAGLGLITTELLDNGVPLVRLYEPCSEFRLELKNFGAVYPGQIELFTKDIFHLSRYDYIDKQDSLNRVEILLRGVPKRSWTSEPVLTIIGCMPKLLFLKYLVRSLVLQRGPTIHGRTQLFAIMRPGDFKILSATISDNLRIYQKWTVLFNLLFNYEHLETFPRNVFVPWDPPGIKKKKDFDKMYLVRINFKEELPVTFEQLLPLLHFIMQFYGNGNNKIIPTTEKWVPNVGYRVIMPELTHDDYFQEMNIFTRFRELTPMQILAVFKELYNFPAFNKSPFMEIIENEYIKSETGETDLSNANFEKHILDDLEEKIKIDTK